MSLGWIDPEAYPFYSFLLLERFQIRLMMNAGGWRNEKSAWRYSMGVSLNANPEVMWYIKQRCPECAALADEIAAEAPTLTDKAEVRKAEIECLASVEDFIVYTTPEAMAERCDFIRGWNKERLFDLADFTGKTVLDIGAGSGRLTFAAAEKADWVYASEPVGTLREYLRDKISEEGVPNVRVLDGLVASLPFPDDTFDIVMSGHVVGDDWDAELAEIARVCKPGGWMLDCPGDSECDIGLNEEMTSRGWEAIRYVGSFGKDVHCYRKQAP